jgi:hypothetical protein
MARAVKTHGTSSNGLLKLAAAFCLGAVVAITATTAFKSNSVATTLRASVSKTAAVSTNKPWGNLEITDIPFENSEEIFLDRAARLKKPEWIFEGGSADQVAAFLQSTDLNETQRRELLATNTWSVTATQCTIHPTDELVLNLSSAAREKIYWALSQCQSNYSQCFPFRFPPNRFDERFANERLNAQSVQFVRRLCYTNDGLISFADLDVASKKLSSTEFDSLIRTLYAVPTVRLRLRVDANTDLNRIIQYWGKGGREKRIRPMLESLARLPGGDSVAIAYLLPGVARMRLYTFPDPTRAPEEAREDCFFTALNFFNKYADNRFFDKTQSRQALQNDYALVTDSPSYGDLITLVNGSGDAVHVAVYIAEDIVFTKNGVNILQPWVLMRMDDMMSYFPSPEPLRVAIFRKKEFTQTAALGR